MMPQYSVKVEVGVFSVSRDAHRLPYVQPKSYCNEARGCKFKLTSTVVVE